MCATSDIKTNPPTSVHLQAEKLLLCSLVGNRLIVNTLLQARPDCDQTLLQRQHYRSPALVYTLQYTASNAVVALCKEYS